MGTVFWIIGVGIVGLVLINLILLRGFKNRRLSHDQFPSDLGIAFEELQIPTENQKLLYGWWIPAERSPAPLVVLTHGWGQNQGFWLPLIPHLHKAGYHIMTFDARNHGHSDGDGYANMLKFAQDILSTLAFARQNYGNHITQYHLVGFSIGGAATIYAAARASEVKRVVTVGAFAHPAQIMREGFRTRHVPYFPIVWSLFKLIEWRIGARLDDIAPQNNIAHISGELLLVHGRHDRTVPLANVFQLLKRAPAKHTRLYILENCEHSNCIPQEEFTRVLLNFLKDGHLPSPKTAAPIHEIEDLGRSSKS